MKTILIIGIGLGCYISAFGQNIEAFTLPNVVNNKEFDLSSYINEKAIVVIFHSGKCAYSEYYLERIRALINEFTPKDIKFLLINSNNSSFVPEESVSEMKIYADRNKMGVPYLADKNQLTKNIFKASRTPEVFILIPNQSKFNIVYRGSIDDSPQSASDVSHSYLKDNLVLLLNNNKTKVNQTRAVGCLIK